MAFTFEDALQILYGATTATAVKAFTMDLAMNLAATRTPEACMRQANEAASYIKDNWDSIYPSSTVVPDVITLTEAAGRAAIIAAGLVPEKSGEANHAVIPAGSIISSDPENPTKVRVGTTVTYIVSLGPA